LLLLFAYSYFLIPRIDAKKAPKEGPFTAQKHETQHADASFCSNGLQMGTVIFYRLLL
jgi:hypothetical protein